MGAEDLRFAELLGERGGEPAHGIEDRIGVGLFIRLPVDLAVVDLQVVVEVECRFREPGEGEVRYN